MLKARHFHQEPPQRVSRGVCSSCAALSSRLVEALDITDNLAACSRLSFPNVRFTYRMPVRSVAEGSPSPPQRSSGIRLVMHAYACRQFPLGRLKVLANTFGHTTCDNSSRSFSTRLHGLTAPRELPYLSWWWLVLACLRLHLWERCLLGRQHRLATLPTKECSENGRMISAASRKAGASLCGNVSLRRLPVQGQLRLVPNAPYHRNSWEATAGEKRMDCCQLVRCARLVINEPLADHILLHLKNTLRYLKHLCRWRPWSPGSSHGHPALDCLEKPRQLE